MKSLREFLEIVDTTGGHILICLLCAVIGATLAIYGHLELGKEFLAFLGIMTYAMRGRDRSNGEDSFTKKNSPGSDGATK